MKQEEIFFRSSGSGALMTEGKGGGITAKQLQTIELLENKLKTPKGITEKQEEELERLIEKRDKPYEISDTAKQFIEDQWLLDKKGYYKNLKNKYVSKGLFQEEEGISLISKVDKKMYLKNEERITKDGLTGECDVVYVENEKKIIQDIKCSWDAKTFMNAKINNLYEWQGRCYMYLYDADEFWLRYCLVDCPPHIVNKQKEYAWREYFSENMGEEQQAELEKQMQPIYAQIERNLVYSTNPKYTEEERVKTYKIYRDDEKFKELLDRMPLAVEYYNQITLNQI